MWNNKREDEAVPGRPAGTSGPGYSASDSTVQMSSSQPSSSPAPQSSGPGATLGPSISVVGELTGDEDLTIMGRVEGTVHLPKNSLTIGRTARVAADIRAKSVSVEGELKGNLIAAEQILIRKTATMLGNLSAPRVGLEDGCRFKGSVDMESPQSARAAEQPSKSSGGGEGARQPSGGNSGVKAQPIPAPRS
jgi:cytoskeletal protein CcmA (bactofilin family)